MFSEKLDLDNRSTSLLTIELQNQIKSKTRPTFVSLYEHTIAPAISCMGHALAGRFYINFYKRKDDDLKRLWVTTKTRLSLEGFLE